MAERSADQQGTPENALEMGAGLVFNEGDCFS
jgi:hypothetical protein